MVVVNDHIRGAFQQLAEPQLADLQRLVAHINAVVGEEIEGVQPDLFVAPSTVQALEIGDPVRTEHNGFSINDEGGFPEPERGLNNQRVTIGPIIAATGQQPDALAFTLDNQAIAIMLYFVKPIRPGGDFGAACWDAR